jgi:hypothetical protein
MSSAQRKKLAIMVLIHIPLCQWLTKVMGPDAPGLRETARRAVFRSYCGSRLTSRRIWFRRNRGNGVMPPKTLPGFSHGAAIGRVNTD